MPKHLKIATRKSPLALQQTQLFADALTAHWPNLSVELVPMSTQGDELLNKTLQYWGGKGLFVKELEKALIENRADIAVHSMKDVPANLPDELMISCIYKRHNPYDALITGKKLMLNELPSNAKIGTASLRRQAQLLAYRPDFQITVLRGNIHTRLQKLNEGQFDAIILACAGLERMHLESLIQQELKTDIMLPACGQGALGIESRKNDKDTLELLAPLHHQPTAICVETERKINALLGGHCHVPIAIFARFINDNDIQVQARVFNPSGTQKITFDETANKKNIMQLADKCAENLISQGALELIKTI